MNNNCQCFCDAAANVFKDKNGKILTSGDVILCRGCSFIVMADGSIDCYTTDKMDCIYYTADKELGALEGRVNELQAERGAGLVTRLWQTVLGNRRRTCRNQIAGIDTLITPSDSPKKANSTSSQTTLGGSYNQGNTITDHVPGQVTSPQVHSMQTGSQVPSYVINNDLFNGNINQGDINALQFHNNQHSGKLLQVNLQGSNQNINNLDRVVQVVKSCQQEVSDLNAFMVTEFRTLFTNKGIDLAATVMPLVRGFNQVCQVFADNINQRYGYELELQALTPEEVQSWAKQFRIPVAQSSLDTSHLQPATNGNQGAISQLAGLFPSQQAQVQPQTGFFPTKQKQPTDNYAKRQESGIHTPLRVILTLKKETGLIMWDALKKHY